MGSSSSKGAGGFRIFSVIPSSPGDAAGLEVFFDFVVEVNGVVVESDKQSFFSMVKDFEGKRVKLTVYNCRSHSLRDVYVIPRQWGGQGLLGLVVKYDSIEEAENQGLRVLDLVPNSPANSAGFEPYKDFIIGSNDVIIRDLDDLGQLLTSFIGQKLSLSIYNSDTETTRQVTITPNRDWGGEGLLGCGIGSGMLHRIPMCRKSFAGNLPETDQSDRALEADSSEVVNRPVDEPAPSCAETRDPVSPQEPSSSPVVDAFDENKTRETTDISRLFD